MPTANRDPSSWLNSQLFQSALVHHTADRSLVVDDVHLALHGNASQQYASTIYRATVSYRSRGKPDTIKLIVKLVSSKVNSLADETSFDAELSVYRHLLPKMEATSSETDAKHFSPKLIYTSREPQPYIILEDVACRQYGHYSGTLGLEDATVVLIKLAQFHATSYCQSHGSKDHTAMAASNGLFKTKPSEGVKFMAENFSIFAEELSRWDGYGKMAERFGNIQPTFIERGIRIYDGANNGFNTRVLNHGDFHYNNMMFRFDNDHHVTDVIFVG